MTPSPLLPLFSLALFASMAAGAAAAPAPTISPAGPAAGGDFLRSNTDPSVSAGDDFFAHANGGWLRRNSIPASESAWGIGNVVREELYTNLRRINEQAAAAGPSARAGSEQRKIGDFWTTALDEARAEAAGLAPLRVPLHAIEGMQTLAEVLEGAAALEPIGVDAFFGFSVGQDEKRSDTMSVHLTQGGLGLPERDFYFNPEPGVARIREEYLGHIARTLQLLGRPEAAARAAATQLLQFETTLAKASRKLEDLRDPEKNYNKMTPEELSARHTPGINWGDRLRAWGVKPSEVVVGQPEFFAALDGLLKATPVPLLQDYLRFHLIDAYAPFLGRDFEQRHFDFHGRVLSGQREPRPRWKRVLDAQDSAMGMVLGRLFVKIGRAHV